MKVAVIGAGWAGCAAAVELSRRGHQPVLFEASRQAGGRARSLSADLNGQPLLLDNGQHILIGAYSQTLGLMQDLGVDPGEHLLRLPLTLQFPDGQGLRLPSWPAWVPPALVAFAGICRATGYSAADKASLLRAALGWQRASFECPADWTVARLCQGLTPAMQQGLIDPLCVSALNTTTEQASAQVFLRVLRDSLFQPGGADLLLPLTDLSRLLPDAALRWLAARECPARLGARVTQIARTAPGWQVSTTSTNEPEPFDAVVLACPALEAARLLAADPALATAAQAWIKQAQSLRYEAIATVYVQASGASLPWPMLALHACAGAPAQFVFDRGQLGGPAGLLAFVVSASSGDQAQLRKEVMTQAMRQLGLADSHLQHVQTVVEKRATFACMPGLQRPPLQVMANDRTLLACGDYVEGPYPATLEGAVRAGLQAARHLG